MDTDIEAGSYDKTDFVPEISPNVDQGTSLILTLVLTFDLEH